MTISPKLILDSIIFGLQPYGGISNYWAKLVEFACNDNDLHSSLVLPNSLIYRDFNSEWLQRMPILQQKIDSRLSRYLSSPSGNINSIFHTSYYRLPRNQVQKYVVTVYDFTYERYFSGLPRFIHSKQKLASIRKADSVICISESTRRDVIDFCPGIDPKKLFVIPLGVDTNIFYHDPHVSNDYYSQTVLFVGQRGGYKRFDLAVEAVRQLPMLSLGIVGPKLSVQERENLHAQLGNRWREFGPVSTNQLRKLYSSVFAFIFPSDYEGFGLPILEAMACGCPVVAAALSSLPEVGGSASLYAEYQTGESYAKILSELESASKRNTAVINGNSRILEFDWFHSLENTKAVYLKITN